MLSTWALDEGASAANDLARLFTQGFGDTNPDAPTSTGFKPDMEGSARAITREVTRGRGTASTGENSEPTKALS